ncbi:MAG TPA: hypothetical protein VGG06_18630 [Thermoanaerobaculia bacterium]|jgi:hypothetical protein
MIGQFTAPIGYLIAGPMADFVFEPLMAEGGPLASTLARSSASARDAASA